MTDFETAARKAAKAAFDVIRHIIAEHPDLFEKTNETHWAARDVLEIEITKHYADLEATFGLLCGLARLSEQVCDDNMQMAEMLYGRDEEGGVPVPQHVSRIYAILNDPRIAALLAEKG